MAANALEAKINKIRQQNEEIRRRHQEVEEDKKNAAKLNALVQMVPSSDWPERKEPPEFSNPPKAKQKPAKEKHEYTLQSHSTGNEGKKVHTFAQGEGPPPDPKYNFLADSEREEPSAEYAKESPGNKFHNKGIRGNFRKKFGGRENHIQKDNKAHKGNYRDESQPGYDAWRAERNRIDEDRISRQRTAEGNWRREWDNDKMHIIDDVTKKTRSTLAEFTKKDHKDSDRRFSNNNEYITHSKSGNRLYRGSSKNFYGNYDNRPHNTYEHRNNAAMSMKTSLSPSSEERTVIATDKSIKVTVNQGNTTKRSVMSVKVNSPSIAGTGRVGPRQRTRVTYSHSDVEASMPESESFRRQKSFEDKSKGTYFNNPKSPNVKRSHSQKKKENDTKYLYYQRKDTMQEDNDTNSLKYGEDEFRSHMQKNVQKSQPVKSSKPIRGNVKSVEQNLNINSSEKGEIQECSNIDSTKLEHETVIENNETLEVCNSDSPNEIELSNRKSNELDVKYDDQNEITELEVKEASSISLTGSTSSDVKNPEPTTKDDKDLSNCNNENSRFEEFANNVTESLQKCSMSSEVPVPNNTDFKVESVPDESNNVSNDIVMVEEILSKNDQQLLEQVGEQVVNDNCDNIKDEIVREERTSLIEDEPVSLLKAEIHSVISIENESTEKGTLLADEKVNENNEFSDKKLNDSANRSDASPENSLNSLMNENKKQVEEIKDITGEL